MKSLADRPAAIVYNSQPLYITLIVKIIYISEVSFGLFSEFDPLKLYYLAYNSDRQKNNNTFSIGAEIKRRNISNSK